jgi:hypothetical protein
MLTLQFQPPHKLRRALTSVAKRTPAFLELTFASQTRMFAYLGRTFVCPERTSDCPELTHEFAPTSMATSASVIGRIGPAWTPTGGFAPTSMVMCESAIGQASRAEPAWMLTLESPSDGAMRSSGAKAMVALTPDGGRSRLRMSLEFARTSTQR